MSNDFSFAYTKKMQTLCLNLYQGAYRSQRDKEEIFNTSSKPTLKDDEEKRQEGKELEILTPNKPLTRLSVSLAQMKLQTIPKD